ncbi:MAG TPA: hypothetical protein VHC20_06880 [Candidatus Paceibacterota bacterium]|nr:hypothetical protein [Candidatus Paceibacterota bacterium]
MIADKTTKALLGAVAVGLLLNAAGSWLQPAPIIAAQNTGTPFGNCHPVSPAIANIPAVWGPVKTVIGLGTIWVFEAPDGFLRAVDLDKCSIAFSVNRTK